MKILIFSLSLLTSPLAAQPASSDTLRCPDEHPPQFTGHPFQPLFCPDITGETEISSATVIAPPAAEDLPELKSRAKATLASLIGRWQCISSFAGTRTTLLLDVAKASGGFQIKLQTMDYHLHTKLEFSGELESASFWKPGIYSAKVRLAHLPQSEKEATVWIGIPPKSRADIYHYDQELALAYKGRPDLHRLQYTWDAKAKKIRFLYTYLYNGTPSPATASCELTPSTLESL